MASTLYRVRDRNTEQQQGTIWGEDLTEHAAELLKEQIVGAGKSRTARVEPMDWDPDVIGEPITVKAQHSRNIGYIVDDAAPPPAAPQVPRGQRPVQRPRTPAADLNAPELRAAREAALRAVAPIAASAQARADGQQPQTPAVEHVEIPDFDEGDLDDSELDGDIDDLETPAAE